MRASHWCTVSWCARVNDSEACISLHRMPKDEHRQKLWLDFLGHPEWLDDSSKKETIRICSIHFTKKDFRFTNSFLNSSILKPIAVPSVRQFSNDPPFLAVRDLFHEDDSCAVTGCRTNDRENPDLTFHRIHCRCSDRVKAWRRTLGLEPENRSKMVCSRHFGAHQYEEYFPNRGTLRADEDPMYGLGPLNPIFNDYSPLSLQQVVLYEALMDGETVDLDLILNTLEGSLSWEELKALVAYMDALAKKKGKTNFTAQLPEEAPKGLRETPAESIHRLHNPECLCHIVWKNGFRRKQTRENNPKQRLQQLDNSRHSRVELEGESEPDCRVTQDIDDPPDPPEASLELDLPSWQQDVAEDPEGLSSNRVLVMTKENYKEWTMGEPRDASWFLIKKLLALRMSDPKYQDRSAPGVSFCTSSLVDPKLFMILCSDVLTASTIVKDLADDLLGRGWSANFWPDARKPVLKAFIPGCVIPKVYALRMLEFFNRGKGLRLEAWRLKLWSETGNGVAVEIEVPCEDAFLVRALGTLCFELRLIKFEVEWPKEIDLLMRSCSYEHENGGHEVEVTDCESSDDEVLNGNRQNDRGTFQIASKVIERCQTANEVVPMLSTKSAKSGSKGEGRSLATASAVKDGNRGREVQVDGRTLGFEANENSESFMADDDDNIVIVIDGSEEDTEPEGGGSCRVEDGGSGARSCQKDGGCIARSRRKDGGIGASSRQKGGRSGARSRQEDGGVDASSHQKDGESIARSRQKDGGVGTSSRQEDGGSGARSRRKDDGGVGASSCQRDRRIDASSRQRDGGSGGRSLQKDGGVGASSRRKDGRIGAISRKKDGRLGAGYVQKVVKKLLGANDSKIPPKPKSSLATFLGEGSSNKTVATPKPSNKPATVPEATPSVEKITDSRDLRWKQIESVISTDRHVYSDWWSAETTRLAEDCARVIEEQRKLMANRVMEDSISGRMVKSNLKLARDDRKKTYGSRKKKESTDSGSEPEFESLTIQNLRETPSESSPATIRAESSSATDGFANLKHSNQPGTAAITSPATIPCESSSETDDFASPNPSNPPGSEATWSGPSISAVSSIKMDDIVGWKPLRAIPGESSSETNDFASPNLSNPPGSAASWSGPSISAVSSIKMDNIVGWKPPKERGSTTITTPATIEGESSSKTVDFENVQPRNERLDSNTASYDNHRKPTARILRKSRSPGIPLFLAKPKVTFEIEKPRKTIQNKKKFVGNLAGDSSDMRGVNVVPDENLQFDELTSGESEVTYYDESSFTFTNEGSCKRKRRPPMVSYGEPLRLNVSGEKVKTYCKPRLDCTDRRAVDRLDIQSGDFGRSEVEEDDWINLESVKKGRACLSINGEIVEASDEELDSAVILA